MTKPGLRLFMVCSVALAVSALAHWLSALGLPPWLKGAAASLNAVAGLAMVLAVPGLAWLPVWRGLGWLDEECDGFYVVLAVGLGTVLCHGISHKAIVLSGYLAEYWPMWWAAVLWAAAGWAASVQWGGALAVRWPRPVVVRCSLGAALAVVCFALATSPPRFVEETNYWPDKAYADFAGLNFGRVDLDREGITVRFGDQWVKRGKRTYDLHGEEARIYISNRGDVAYPLDLILVLRNNWRTPLVAEFEFDGRTLREGELTRYARQRRGAKGIGEDYLLLWPRFDHTVDPRDRPPHLVLAAPTLEVPPGDHVLRVEILPSRATDEAGPRVTLFDLSNTTAAEFYRELSARFFVADTGDLYETLDFSRNFRLYWIQHSSSFNPTIPDSGGATSISDEPPGHHFLCFLALTFIRDSITSISLLFLVELMLLVALAVQFAAWDNNAFRWWHVLPLLGVSFAYTRLCRLGAESNAPDTLFLLVWLCVMWAHLDGRERLAGWLVGVAWLIHIPTPQCVVFTGVASWLAMRDRRGIRFIVRAFLVILAVTAIRVLLISMDAGLRGALFSGQARFGGVQRLELLREILIDHDWSRIVVLLHVARNFARLVLIASCGAIPIAAVSFFVRVRAEEARARAKTTVLLLFGVFYYLAMSLIDTQRAHHVGPIAFPLMIAAVRRVAFVDRVWIRRLLFGAMVASAVAAVVYLLHAGPDYTGTFTSHPIYQLTHPSSRRGYGFHAF